MLSTFSTIEWLTGRPRILDVDDAIWLHSKRPFAEKLARDCSAVICGNSFIAAQFSRWNEEIRIIPTAVDTDRFMPRIPPPNESLIIGWSGTSSGHKYLMEIEEELCGILARFPDCKLRIISDRMPEFSRLNPDRINFIKWSEEVEVSSIQDITVGIMPLHDDLWSQGKCSFKMLTYMACGIPVVASPVGMNSEILGLAQLGFGPKNSNEWVDALSAILEEPQKYKNMGINGRSVALAKYSIHAVAPQIAKAVEDVIHKAKRT